MAVVQAAPLERTMIKHFLVYPRSKCFLGVHRFFKAPRGTHTPRASGVALEGSTATGLPGKRVFFFSLLIIALSVIGAASEVCDTANFLSDLRP